jgi:hypothetical protein
MFSSRSIFNLVHAWIRKLARARKYHQWEDAARELHDDYLENSDLIAFSLLDGEDYVDA